MSRQVGMTPNVVISSLAVAALIASAAASPSCFGSVIRSLSVLQDLCHLLVTPGQPSQKLLMPRRRLGREPVG